MKIVQLFPAPPGWYALLGSPGDAIKHPVPFFALVEDINGWRRVVPMIQDTREDIFGRYLIPADQHPKYFELWDPIHTEILRDAREGGAT
jgi:hypothetical protein